MMLWLKLFCLKNQGRGLVDRKLGKAPPVFFIAGRPKAALLLWFFGDFRCGALLFVVEAPVATCPSIQLPALLFVCVLFWLFVDVLSGEPKQN